ncbi:MAG: hypothetical protein GY941_16130, partial [Planctomycetes bacterium]|nr:hypothetical protein [Planctomycetota bacterium]
MKKNVAGQSIGVQMITVADGSAFTGTVTVYVTGDAGTQAIGDTSSGVCTHKGNGYHTYVPTQAETNYDFIAFTYIGTGAIPVTSQVYTGSPQTGDNYLGVTAKTNLTSMYDGTGYTDDTAPASRSQVNSIGASSGGSINIEASDDNSVGGTVDPLATVFVGSITANTLDDTQSANGVAHEMNDVGNDIDIVYQFNLAGNQQANAVDIFANVNGNADNMTVSAYDHVANAWGEVGTLDGSGGTDYKSISPSLLLKHVGVGSELGKVYIRLHTEAGSSPASLQVDKILVQAVNTSQSVGYAGGYIYVDTVNGESGSEKWINGVGDKKVNNWADAL